MAARRNSGLRLAGAAGAVPAILLVAVMLVAGCTSGDRPEPSGPAAGPASTSAAPAEPPLRVRLVATAKAPPDGLSAGARPSRPHPGWSGSSTAT